MYVLGIETSCDETAASVVKDGRRILSNVVTSSLSFHKKYGGVVPEIASRLQLEMITEVVHCAIEEARVKLEDISLVSVTNGPGLLGSLLVGISFAKALSLSLGIFLLGVDHLYSHIYANFLNVAHVPASPFIALIISGGHTSLFYVEDFDRIKALGSTQDDACGEAFDKVAKILGLGYPGGPVVERLSKKGNPHEIRFSCSNTKSPLNFSFSGIKTAVLYYVQRTAYRVQSCGAKELTQYAIHNTQYTIRNTQYAIHNTQYADIAASFQEAVIDTLFKKSLLACKLKKVNRIVIGGGVARNNRLRKKFFQGFKEKGIHVYFPSTELCVDNAAMVAGLGYQLFKKGARSSLDLTAQSS